MSPSVLLHTKTFDSILVQSYRVLLLIRQMNLIGSLAVIYMYLLILSRARDNDCNLKILCLQFDVNWLKHI